MSLYWTWLVNYKFTSTPAHINIPHIAISNLNILNIFLIFINNIWKVTTKQTE